MKGLFWFVSGLLTGAFIVLLVQAGEGTLDPLMFGACCVSAVVITLMLTMTKSVEWVIGLTFFECTVAFFEAMTHYSSRSPLGRTMSEQQIFCFLSFMGAMLLSYVFPALMVAFAREAWKQPEESTESQAPAEAVIQDAPAGEG